MTRTNLKTHNYKINVKVLLISHDQICGALFVLFLFFSSPVILMKKAYTINSTLQAKCYPINRTRTQGYMPVSSVITEEI